MRLNQARRRTPVLPALGRLTRVSEANWGYKVNPRPARDTEPGVLEHPCNPSPWEAEPEGPTVKAILH